MLTRGVSILNALDLIHTVSEVEKRLADDMSYKIYEIRLNYLIYNDYLKLREELVNLASDWRFSPKSEQLLDKAKKIIIFGVGEWGQHTFHSLKRSKYKDKSIIFCDNKVGKSNRGGVYQISKL